VPTNFKLGEHQMTNRKKSLTNKTHRQHLYTSPFIFIKENTFCEPLSK